MNTADIIAVVALVVSTGAGVLSYRSLHWERASAAAARRSADAAEHANRLAERLAPPYTPLAGGADVRWTMERPSRYVYVLRNVGEDTAEHVRVDPAGLDGRIVRGLPTDSTIRPGDSVEFLVKPTSRAPAPNQIWVTWGDPGQSCAVPSRR